jgi:hypothetical protein
MKPRPIESHLRAYVCIHVCEEVRPVLLVTRAGGPRYFRCGDTHPQDASSYRVFGIGHLFERDPGLSELKDLPPTGRPNVKVLDALG